MFKKTYRTENMSFHMNVDEIEFFDITLVLQDDFTYGPVLTDDENFKIVVDRLGGRIDNNNRHNRLGVHPILYNLEKNFEKYIFYVKFQGDAEIFFSSGFVGPVYGPIVEIPDVYSKNDSLVLSIAMKSANVNTELENEVNLETFSLQTFHLVDEGLCLKLNVKPNPYKPGLVFEFIPDDNIEIVEEEMIISIELQIGNITKSKFCYGYLSKSHPLYIFYTQLEICSINKFRSSFLCIKSYAFDKNSPEALFPDYLCLPQQFWISSLIRLLIPHVRQAWPNLNLVFEESSILKDWFEKYFLNYEVTALSFFQKIQQQWFENPKRTNFTATNFSFFQPDQKCILSEFLKFIKCQVYNGQDSFYFLITYNAWSVPILCNSEKCPYQHFSEGRDSNSAKFLFEHKLKGNVNFAITNNVRYRFIPSGLPVAHSLIGHFGDDQIYECEFSEILNNIQKVLKEIPNNIQQDIPNQIKLYPIDIIKHPFPTYESSFKLLQSFEYSYFIAVPHDCQLAYTICYSRSSGNPQLYDKITLIALPISDNILNEEFEFRYSLGGINYFLIPFTKDNMGYPAFFLVDQSLCQNYNICYICFFQIKYGEYIVNAQIAPTLMFFSSSSSSSSFDHRINEQKILSKLNIAKSHQLNAKIAEKMIPYYFPGIVFYHRVYTIQERKIASHVKSPRKTK